MTTLNKLGKLNQLKATQNLPSQTTKSADQEEAIQKNGPEGQNKTNGQGLGTEPVVSLAKSEMNAVIEAKVDAKVSKQIQAKAKKKESEAQPVTHTKIRADFNFEVGLLCKKNKVFQFALNNHLYEKLINDKEFAKQIFNEMKENGETRA